MKVGIDVSRTIPRRERAGIGKYADLLVTGLARLDTDHEFILYPGFGDFVHPEYGVTCDIAVPHRPNFKKYTGPLPAFSAPGQRAAGNAVDVVHATAFSCPHVQSAKLVITLYDLTYRLHPEFHLPSNIEFCEKHMKNAADRAHYFIAISEQTRKDFIAHYGIAHDRTAVIPLAAHPDFAPTTDRERLVRTLQKHELFSNYILHVGSIEPRKNLSTLLKAFAALAANGDFQRYILVLAGTAGWLNEEIYALPRSLRIADQVRFLGYVDDEDLPVLYSAARLFVYPSLYEGFGLSVLEAMSCGAPVIASNVSSLPEVTGDAAILIDPRDTGAMARTMRTVLENTELRMTLRRQSLERAKRFSVEKMARETLRVYETVYRTST